MEKKTSELNENLTQNQDALKEILGDIKNVVSEEAETRFKSKVGQKVIKLKKSDLVNSKTGNQPTSGALPLNKVELEALVRKIVRQELGKKGENLREKKIEDKEPDSLRKAKTYPLSKMTKAQLEEIGRKSGIDLDRRKTKASLIKELEAKGKT